MEIWINIGAKYFLYQCHSIPCHLSWLGLSPWGVHGPRSSLCCYLAVPGGCGMYSNHWMSGDFLSCCLKWNAANTIKVGCRRAKSTVLPSPCQVQSVLWKCTHPLERLGMGPVSEGLGLSILLLAVWALNHHRHIPGFRQLQPTASKGEELPSAHLQGLAKMDCVPCNMHY